MAGSVAAALPPTHQEALALAHLGPLFRAENNFWGSRVAVWVSGTSAAAVCLACAFTVGPLKHLLQSCWAYCANLTAAEGGDDVDETAGEQSFANESHMVLGSAATSGPTLPASSSDGPGRQTPTRR